MKEIIKYHEIAKVSRRIDVYEYKGFDFLVVYDHRKRRQLESCLYVRHPDYEAIHLYSGAGYLPGDNCDETNIHMINSSGDEAIEAYYKDFMVSIAWERGWPPPINPFEGQASPRALREARTAHEAALYREKKELQKARDALRRAKRKQEREEEDRKNTGVLR